ncbi:hypothetical protein DFP73DRAFT_262547 [Morchella snyderi]|nr:hypothetical protein DFP73DRAFT_262547 [Morchella snyderi]
MKIFNFTAVLQVAVAVWATEIDQSKANDGILLERGQPQADSNGAAAIVVTVIQTEKVEVHFTKTLHTTDVSTKAMHVTEQVQVHVTETLHVTDVSTEVMHVTE